MSQRPAAPADPARCRPGPAGRTIRPRRPRRLRPARLTSGPWPRPPERSPSWPPGNRSAGPARGWSAGVSRWRRTSGARSRPSATGGVQYPAGAPSSRACSSSAWPRRHTAGIAPGGSSPGIAAETFCLLPSGGAAWPPHPTSVSAGDGQQLLGVRMAAAVRCAPPANKPSVAERDACAPWLTAELAQVRESVRVIVCLGHFAWQAIWPQLGLTGFRLPGRGRPSATAQRSGWSGQRSAREARAGTRAEACCCSVATTRVSRTPLPAA